ncbi:aquaporin-like protein [Daedalea quercina L-15889]|uniref:Aquaporin-like protein n=1 Tax=Daedalea quercina L-15889 TaxID=1314783 RepID=A0A165QGB5_9APHY|nr:aquaporin-like protein [Daedalea quercina L-15889]
MHPSATIPAVHLADVYPQPRLLAVWQKHRRGRARWFVEFVAEAMSTFLYTYAGTGSTASYILGSILGLPNIGNLFQIGFAYALGVVLAMVIALPTSNGHANPAFTVCAVLTRKCTPLRGLRPSWRHRIRLIVAQILGAYIACLLIYVQYHDLIKTATEELRAKGLYDSVMFTSQGPGGIFGIYSTAGANLGYAFLNEFVCDFILAVVVFGCIDPTNILCPPVVAPWIIGFTYAIIIWGFVPASVAANSARDVGGRLAVLTLWGTPATGGRYAAIAALTNIPATILGGIFYHFIFSDSDRVVTRAALDLSTATKAYEERGAVVSQASSVKGDIEYAERTLSK